MFDKPRIRAREHSISSLEFVLHVHLIWSQGFGVSRTCTTAPMADLLPRKHQTWDSSEQLHRPVP